MFSVFHTSEKCSNIYHWDDKTLGATLMKGLNRGLGTIFAAFVGLVFDNFANKVSTAIEPYIVGSAVFIIGNLYKYITIA